MFNLFKKVIAAILFIPVLIYNIYNSPYIFKPKWSPPKMKKFKKKEKQIPKVTYTAEYLTFLDPPKPGIHKVDKCHNIAAMFKKAGEEEKKIKRPSRKRRAAKVFSFLTVPVITPEFKAKKPKKRRIPKIDKRLYNQRKTKRNIFADTEIGSIQKRLEF